MAAPERSGGFAMLPNVLLDHSHELGLDSGDIHLIALLERHRFADEDAPFPSVSTLADRMGVHRSTVQRRIKRLEQRNLLVRERRVSKAGGQASNGYRLTGLDAALAALGAARPPRGNVVSLRRGGRRFADERRTDPADAPW